MVTIFQRVFHFAMPASGQYKFFMPAVLQNRRLDAAFVNKTIKNKIFLIIQKVAHRSYATTRYTSMNKALEQ